MRWWVHLASEMSRVVLIFRKTRRKKKKESNNWQRRVIIIISPGVRRWARVPGRRPKINIPGDSSGTLSGNARRPDNDGDAYSYIVYNTRVFGTLRPAPMCLFRSFDALQTDQVRRRICIVAVAAQPPLHSGKKSAYIFIPGHITERIRILIYILRGYIMTCTYRVIFQHPTIYNIFRRV